MHFPEMFKATEQTVLTKFRTAKSVLLLNK